MSGHLSAPTCAASADRTAALTRLVLVDGPRRLDREALVAAIDAVPGLAAVDAAHTGGVTADRIDAAVLTARSQPFRWPTLADESQDAPTPTPVVVIADNGPAVPSLDRRGLVVVSGETPLATIIDCLVADPADLELLPAWRGDAEAELGLTAREREVLELLASGLSPTEVARRLAITTHTARDHIKSIRRKLDRPTIMAAVLEAIRLGVLRLDAA